MNHLSDIVIIKYGIRTSQRRIGYIPVTSRFSLLLFSYNFCKLQPYDVKNTDFWWFVSVNLKGAFLLQGAFMVMKANWDPRYIYRAPFEAIRDIVRRFIKKAPLNLWKKHQNPKLLLKKTMFWDSKGAFSKTLACKVSAMLNSNYLNFWLSVDIFSAS